MARNAARPLSPHLSVWKWGPHMAVSIFHRATGTALALGGGVLFTWWLVAAASGPEAYAKFVGLLTVSSGALNIVGYIFFIGLTWAFFQHLLSGIRHLVLDSGAGYELHTNKRYAMAVFVGAIVLTALVWIWHGVR